MRAIIVDDEMNAHYTFLDDVIDSPDDEYRFFKDDPRLITDFVRKNRVDVAFLDVNMPGVNGVALADELVAIAPEIRFVFVTGYDVSEKDLSPAVRDRTVTFIYKPYDAVDLRRIIDAVRRCIRRLTVRTFGSFDCFVDDRPVRFSSAKSKELFALLIAYNGKSLTMNDAISQLWPDLETDKSKVLYRDAVWRLRKALDFVGCNCVEFRRACLFLNKEYISCDYWDRLAGLNGDYKGEFLKSYDWSVDYLPALDS